MNPISFKEQTKILNKPEGMTDKECSPLPVWNGDGKRCISCWKGNLKERILFLFTGKIWLWVWYGQTQPLVCVDIIHPFKKTLKEKIENRYAALKIKFRRQYEIIGNQKPINLQSK
jgi:hypothetical protein